MTAPIVFECFRNGMKPLARFNNVYAAQFEVGKRYVLVEAEDRSSKSHRHFFASVHDLWLTLPESMADRFATSEHLRKWALIKAGYRDERTFVASSKAEAVRLAAFIRPSDEYAIVVVSGATVIVYTAKSQGARAMGKAVFQESKDAVFRVISELIGTSQQVAQREAGMAA